MASSHSAASFHSLGRRGLRGRCRAGSSRSPARRPARARPSPRGRSPAHEVVGLRDGLLHELGVVADAREPRLPGHRELVARRRRAGLGPVGGVARRSSAAAPGRARSPSRRARIWFSSRPFVITMMSRPVSWPASSEGRELAEELRVVVDLVVVGDRDAGLLLELRERGRVPLPRVGVLRLVDVERPVREVHVRAGLGVEVHRRVPATAVRRGVVPAARGEDLATC